MNLTNPLSLFKYKYVDNKASKTIFLFHGTGGNENDFLFLNDKLDHNYNLVGLKGNVDENGMNRFFRRIAFGVFDLENIKEEVEKLRSFIEEWMKIHDSTTDNMIYLGYSNGANMLLAFLFYNPHLTKNLILLHPMLPFIPNSELDLSTNNIFLSYGIQDPVVLLNQSKKVVDELHSYGSKLTVMKYNAGHEITNEELSNVIEYIENTYEVSNK